MKPLVLKPELVLPWEHGIAEMSLLKRAREEKAMSRSLDEILRDAEEAVRVIRHPTKANQDVGEGWFYVPLVPVMEAPEDLKEKGSHIIYNGHHRLAAAKEVGIYLPCMLIESDEDLEKAVRRGEGLSTDKKEIPFTYLAHRAEIHRLARKYDEAEKNKIKEKPYQRHWGF
ncbi:MAG: hypothetical protein PHO02_03300 [Candidatus Nanoarchaeia archaeon]|nr:hypothetical protein [Candidatus Nanoarchaeia archaeon]